MLAGRDRRDGVHRRAADRRHGGVAHGRKSRDPRAAHSTATPTSRRLAMRISAPDDDDTHTARHAAEAMSETANDLGVAGARRGGPGSRHHARAKIKESA